jgi:hypothetical protein
MRLIVALFAVLVTPALASAQGNTDPNVIHACVGNVTKIVRIVGANGKCISSPPILAETAVTWNVQGPQPQRAAGRCFDNVNRYVDCGNGTVTDTSTGLIWLKQVDCLGITDWASAMTAAAGLKHGNCNLTDGSSPGDWRLPTADEWNATMWAASLLNCHEKGGPGIPLHPFLTNDSGLACWVVGPSSFASASDNWGGFWTSSSLSNEPFDGLFARFDTRFGFVDVTGRGGREGVWPVRGGPVDCFGNGQCLPAPAPQPAPAP